MIFSSIGVALLSIISIIFFDQGDDILDYLDGTRAHNEKNLFLTGNFAPIQTEGTHISPKITHGAVPSDFPDGIYLRNGPNNKFDGPGKYHWFDGDGMIHALRVKDTHVSFYANHWLRTHRFKDAEKAGKRTGVPFNSLVSRETPILNVIKFFVAIARYIFGIGGHTSESHVEKLHTFNTHVLFHKKRLFGVLEAGVPFEFGVNDVNGSLHSIGTTTFDDQWRHAFTAHYKIDPSNQDLMFVSGYGNPKENAIYGALNGDQKLIAKRVIPNPFGERKIIMHEFGATENYAIVMYFPYIKEGLFSPFAFRPDAKTHFAVISRHDPDADLLWFSFEAQFIFHIFNAWEETNANGEIEIVIPAVKYDDTFTIDFCVTPRPFETKGVTEYRMNLATGRSSQIMFEKANSVHSFIEMPRVNDDLAGRKTRYGYASSWKYFNENLAKNSQNDIDLKKWSSEKLMGFSGCLKYDLSTHEIIGQIEFDEDESGGPECVYVSKNGEGLDEDDGYLIVFVWNRMSNESDFRIYNAKTFSNEPLAIVDLPHRVPYGFHGIYVKDRDRL